MILQNQNVVSKNKINPTYLHLSKTLFFDNQSLNKYKGYCKPAIPTIKNLVVTRYPFAFCDTIKPNYFLYLATQKIKITRYASII